MNVAGFREDDGGDDPVLGFVVQNESGVERGQQTVGIPRSSVRE